MNFNDYIEKSSAVTTGVSWFSISRLARKLAYAFSLNKPKKSETAEKLDKLCSKEDRWPEKPMHVRKKDLDRLDATPEKGYVREYRRSMVNTVEDLLADICVSLFSLMSKYNKRFEYEPIVKDVEMNNSYSETFKDKDNYSVCEFLVRSLHNIVHREKETSERNRIIDFESVISFVFWLAVRLGVNNLESYISRRLTYELLKAVKYVKKKTV